MILLQTPYGTKYIIVTNSLQTEMALLEATAIKSGQQPKQGLVGLPKMKETTVAVGRGITMFLISMMMICFIQMQTLQAFFVLEAHASTALNQRLDTGACCPSHCQLNIWCGNCQTPREVSSFGNLFRQEPLSSTIQC